ncbi:DNA-binding MarR family transcriptional regulator [Breznakia sp. PF5-3]|uniref:MarR family winged helix-turn-helix transcriptional regulator n=1 Tax=unclassified Breznakia TaxID=2623764 RepID=UPI002406AE0D|nr:MULTISPECIES: MarR family transcriptional regulator [unclassified Breznakia]MDF9825335.1 DNA-binding MarR family transcriptional regulator [Breznakia sp. PM6-1]MDF9836190.1 DNA-binding MarR family transcriptional regulator [Breznakia sp. PF5-3]MDF9838412.1 DNA-binding MarR family transcriptional regulator [Breznakia sp. PFB2-8]MDF9860428.1 DNA-binding MarR family transcriptional regulator [Breznakia sp. PH5-24]
MLKNKELYNLEQEIEWLEKKVKYIQLNRIEIHDGQPEILAYIYMHKNCNQYEIAKYLGLSRASIGVSIKRLQKAGFVDVLSNEQDARATCLQITKKGIKTLVQSDIVLDEYISKKYDGFSDEELVAYIKMLEKVKRNLKKTYKDGKGL